ncbi:hypothetical protein SISSUDRAFT_1122802 [Sistotremastrum suecicum HHB10207 ss-3]|uniref:F-box domain-containing protein n=1 Tax=Sistotremastrum suecicum HHB10207 ss-3 TaxID=1314776 RepID=A0A165YTS8_9AGAM|nr:hypothetical protein SISSUDRAFT_1122802 [Sistotremastrum suecicum HHB10207 ss-3]
MNGEVEGPEHDCPSPARAFWNTPELVAIALKDAERGTLAACTQVSKIPSDCAIDGLYRSCSGLIRVLNLICHLKFEDDEDDDGPLELSEPITPGHWDRFRYYSHRIRELWVHPIFDHALSDFEDQLREISLSIPQGETLLPMLRTLRWEAEDAVTPRVIEFLLHEGLKEASISLPGADAAITLKHISRRSPRLERLHLKLDEDDDYEGYNLTESCSSCLTAVQSLTLLQSLAVPTEFVTRELVLFLASKPGLANLQLASHALDSSPPHPAIPREDLDDRVREPFAEMHTLSITTSRLLDMPRCLIEGPRLMSLHIELDKMDHIGRALPLICNSCRMLKEFSMIISPVLRELYWEDGFWEIDMLRPLLTMRTLEVLIIEHPIPPELGNQDMESIARSFPELRHFEFCVQAKGWLPFKCPTLKCLTSFARHCRKLTSLGVYLNARDVIPIPLHRVEQCAFSGSLEVLEVFCGLINDHEPVVDFLASIMPSKARLEVSEYSVRLRPAVGEMSAFEPMVYMDEGEKRRYDKWLDASRLLASLSTVRKVIEQQRKAIRRGKKIRI